MAKFSTWMKWLFNLALTARQVRQTPVAAVCAASAGLSAARAPRHGLRILPSVTNWPGVMSRLGAAVAWYLVLQVSRAVLRWLSVCGNLREGIVFKG